MFRFPSSAFTFVAPRVPAPTVPSVEPAAAPEEDMRDSPGLIAIPRGLEENRQEDCFVHPAFHASQTYLRAEELEKLLATGDPTEREVARPISYNDADYVNCEYTIRDSMGAIFADSLYKERRPEHVQGHIRARGGGERQWYEGADRSLLSCPEILTGSVNFELINQIQAPGRCPANYPIITFGQAVWRRNTSPALGGCKVEYDSSPYIVVSQCFTTYHYVLMTQEGRIYPYLVPPEQLEPIRTTWTAARVPSNWQYSKDVQKVLQTGRRPRDQ